MQVRDKAVVVAVVVGSQFATVVMVVIVIVVAAVVGVKFAVVVMVVIVIVVAAVVGVKFASVMVVGVKIAAVMVVVVGVVFAVVVVVILMPVCHRKIALVNKTLRVYYMVQFNMHQRESNLKRAYPCAFSQYNLKINHNDAWQTETVRE